MRNLVCLTFALSCLFSPVSKAETCGKDQKQLNAGEPCIPEPLFYYLYCLSRSGGGKIEVVNKDQTETTKTLEINVQGKGSGIVIKGEGGGGVKIAEASRAGTELSEKLDPTLAERCESILALLQEQAPEPPRMSIETDINREGGDYKDFVANDIDDCVAACIQEQQCKAITFTKSSRQCWMKSSVPYRSENPRYISAVKVGI